MPPLALICALLSIAMALGVGAAAAQAPSKPKTPAEIAAASRLMAEKNADCLAQAKEQKLGFLKRRAFLRACRKESK
jgi:hypothetical protein